jgi:pectinesterase
MTPVSRRLFLGTVAAAGLSSPAAWAAEPWDAVVQRAGHAPIAGAPSYPDLTSAIAAAPADGRRPFRILIGPGVHEGQVVVDKPFIHLVGEDRHGIGHQPSGSVRTGGADDGRNWGTFRTATLFVRAPDFHASNLTINNAFDGLAEMTKPGGLRSHDGAGPQAVALMLDAGLDRAVIRDCDILGYQDTLFANVGTALFERCLIVGSYDFIFGAGRVWFEGCEIRSRPRPGDPTSRGLYRRAQHPDRPAVRLRLPPLPPDEGGGDGERVGLLGRPWRPTTTFPDGRYGDPRFVAAASYLDCWMDDHIAPAGWTEMWYTGRDGNPRTMLQPEDVRFSQYGSRGPGKAAFARGMTLTAEQAGRISRALVIGENVRA